MCARWLLVCCLFGGGALAQTDPAVEPPPMPPAEPSPSVPTELPPIANAPLEPEPPVSRAPRIGFSLLGGVAAGTVGAVIGGFVGSAFPELAALRPIGNAWALAGLGSAVLAPIGVFVVQRIIGGDGAWWATLIGDLVGFGLGAAAVWLGGWEATPVYFALPIAGSLIGLEATSSDPQPRVAVGFQRSGERQQLVIMGQF